MKFSVKLTLAMAVLLALVLSLGGTLLVRQNFDNALQQAIAQSTGTHLMERYSIEAYLLDAAANREQGTNEQLRRSAEGMGEYLGAAQESFALLADGKAFVYSNLPQSIGGDDVQAALDAGSEQCIIREAEGRYYLLMASEVQNSLRALTLVSVSDITSIFASRDAQLRYLWQLEAVLLTVAILLTALLSRVLTRPIRRLRDTAHEIADGAYGRRTGVTTKDEIGDLAKEFDRMAEEVQQNVEQLGRSVQQRDDFVAAFSHEVKTPITALVGYADILRRTEEAPQVRRMAATYIYREARRLEALGRKLMELMGLAEGEIEPEAIRAKDLMKEIYVSLASQIPKLRLGISGDVGTVLLVDKVLACDLLHNLIGNAAHAGPEGSPIRVHFRKGKNSCRVLVSDRGRGIPREEIRRITEPFYMVDKSRSRKQGGSGMGLALAQKIARLYGGELRFCSRPGAGTVVRFTLPMCKATEEKNEK